MGNKSGKKLLIGQKLIKFYSHFPSSPCLFSYIPLLVVCLAAGFPA